MKSLPSELWRSAVEAAEWWEKALGGSGDPSRMWSAELRPSQQLVLGNDRRVVVAGAAEAAESVKEVVERRRMALERLGWVWNGQRMEKRAGRLLVFDRQRTLSDGAANDVSGGLFDIDNQPAWDTWVGLVSTADSPSSILVAWIPPKVVRHAEIGILANAENCLEWF